MEQERYVSSKVSETVIYEFISEGPKGNITKRVFFRLMEEGPERIYNISFGDSDISGHFIDDRIVTNNADSQKVLQTVASTALAFIHNHQNVWVHAEGSTPSFQKGVNYEAFLIRRK
jgi:hypothetical protein